MFNNDLHNKRIENILGASNIVVKQYYSQVQRMAKSFDKFNALSSKHFLLNNQNSISQEVSSIALAQEKMGGCIDSLKTSGMVLQATMEAYQDALQSVEHSVKRFSKGISNVEDKMQFFLKIQASILELDNKYNLFEIEKIPLNEIIENDGNNLVLDGEVIKRAEIDRKFEQISDRINNSVTYDDFIQDIQTIFDNTKSSPLRIIVKYIIVIIFSLFANLATPHVRELIYNNDKRTKIKIINNIGKDLIRDTLDSSQIRFVTADKLNVRKSNSRKTMILDCIEFGQIVIIKYKRKNWSYIEYVDPESNKKESGWVFTRYLKQFK